MATHVFGYSEPASGRYPLSTPRPGLEEVEYYQSEAEGLLECHKCRYLCTGRGEPFWRQFDQLLTVAGGSGWGPRWWRKNSSWLPFWFPRIFVFIPAWSSHFLKKGRNIWNGQLGFPCFSSDGPGCGEAVVPAVFRASSELPAVRGGPLWQGGPS